jgi:hypothetical protein
MRVAAKCSTVPTLGPERWYPPPDMTKESDSLKTIGELIDRVERIREELLAVQHSLEKMEPAEARPAEDGNQK